MEDHELHALRAKLNRRLGRDFPEPLWEWLREHRDVDAAVESALGSEVAFEDLVYEASPLLVGYDMGRKAERVEALGPEHLVPPGRGPAADESVAVTLNAHERDRVAALSACLARRAAQRADVRAFRRDILNGTLLGPEQARRFLTSPAARLLPPEQFQEHVVSPGAHTAVFAPVPEPWPIPLLPETVRYHEGGMVGGLDQQGRAWGLSSVFVDPPGSTVTAPFRVTNRDSLVPDYGARTWRGRLPKSRVEPALVEFDAPVLVPYAVGWDRDQTTGQELFEFADLSGDTKAGRTRVTIWPGSLLLSLREMARILEQRYNWPRGSGAWFVVTGQAPPVVTISGTAWVDATSRSPSEEGVDSAHSFCRFNLTGAIWIPPETVQKACRRLQAGMLRQANRRVRKRALTLLRFVEEQASDEGELPPWRTLVRRWNHAYPDWAYRTADGAPDVPNCAKAYRRAYREVVTREYPVSVFAVRG